MKMTNMTLYYKPTCPFCVKVLNFMKDNGIELDMKNTEDPIFLAELEELNGKTQVPCLVVGDHPMLESDDIISFLNLVLHQQPEA